MFAVPLPHSDSGKFLWEEAIGNLIFAVQSLANRGEYKNHTAWKLNSLVKGHLALQRRREFERRSCRNRGLKREGSFSSPKPVWTGRSAAALGAFHPCLTEGDMGESFFALIRQASASLPVGELLSSDLASAKEAILALLQTQVFTHSVFVPILLSLSLGFSDLPALLQ